VLLSVLAGHWRFAHMTTLRCDRVNPPLLEMEGVASEGHADFRGIGLGIGDELGNGFGRHGRVHFRDIVNCPPTTASPPFLSGTSLEAWSMAAGIDLGFVSLEPRLRP
jgi:hypothetical protein